MRRTFQTELAGRTLTMETGWLAGQANGAVTVHYGDTFLLVTACMSPAPREGVDFLPLTVDYEERLYAAGKIPGSFFRREGRPGQEATLAARLTDRPLRPLFPKGFHNEVQVVSTVLSTDRENLPDILSIIGASAALSISDIPFGGPISGSRVGMVNGTLVVNPTYSQLQESQLEVVVAGTKDAVVMVEAGARELEEAVVIEAVRQAQEANRQVIEVIERMVREVGKPKAQSAAPPVPGPEVEADVKAIVGERLRAAIFSGGEKGERDSQLEALRQETQKALDARHTPEVVESTFSALVRRTFREGVLRDGVRPDGRGYKDIRPIQAAVGILPRTHGSGLFSRGQTQVLTIATLGSPGEEQKLDTLSLEETKRYMHHYNFPPYSTGETKRIGSPGRREIGHGALAERSLEPVIPPVEEFPYTIRLVTEVLSSNGSTSMASACGSTLALLDAGVPIKAPVAGAAMGLVMGKDGHYAVLTDIQGIEDHMGDMDFKVAGTARGITALQMDIKVGGITYEIMEKALAQAREARFTILKRMAETIATPRPNLSPYAPRMMRMTIPVEKIGAVIGPGGKTIRSIIEETKATIDVEDDGTVFIGSPNEEALQAVKKKIEALTQDVEVGAIYTGKVTRVNPLGAFVEILPGKEGLVRAGEFADRRVGGTEGEVKVGDQITVKVIEIDRMGRLNLSRRAVLEGTVGPGHEGEEQPRPRPRPLGPSGPRPGADRYGERPSPGGGPRFPYTRPSGPPRGGDYRPGFGPRRPPDDRFGGGRPPGERQ